MRYSLVRSERLDSLCERANRTSRVAIANAPHEEDHGPDPEQRRKARTESGLRDENKYNRSEEPRNRPARARATHDILTSHGMTSDPL